jgi:hypothetical protein
MKLQKEDVALVQIAIEQWERIGAAFTAGLEKGRRVYRAETNACKQQQRLCRLREEHDLEAGSTIADMAICRKCPIVLSTRRTCFGNVSRLWEHDLETTFSDAALAQEFAAGVVAFLTHEVLNG